MTEAKYPYNKSEVVIRPATQDDATLIAQVLAMALDGDGSHPLFDIFCQLSRRDDTQYSYRNTLVAEVEGSAAGAIVGYDGAKLHHLRRALEEILRDIYGEEFILEEETSAGEFYIDSVAILPEFRGLGIGQILISTMCNDAFAAGFNKVGLLVDFDNPRAESLYTSLGFKRVNPTTFLGHNMWHMQTERDVQLVIGGYGKKIYRANFNTCSEELSITGSAEAINASYAVAMEGNIFTFSESGADSKAYSFKCLAQGEIRPTSEIDCPWADPCFAIVSEDGRWFLTADYSGGSISLYPIENGVLGESIQKLIFEGRGPHPKRQIAPHIHQVRWLPKTYGFEGEWLLATDLGTDKIHLVKMECSSDGEAVLHHIEDIEAPEGSGPRHMEFNQKDRILYCLTELSGEVLVYRISYENGKPEFQLIQKVAADENNAGGSADIHLHPSGRYLYTSHRLQNDGLAQFELSQEGTIQKKGYTQTQEHPRNFLITPNGRHILVASKNEHSIQVFKIDENGIPKPTNHFLNLSPDEPTSITLFNFTTHHKI